MTELSEKPSEKSPENINKHNKVICLIVLI